MAESRITAEDKVFITELVQEILGNVTAHTEDHLGISGKEKELAKRLLAGDTDAANIAAKTLFIVSFASLLASVVSLAMSFQIDLVKAGKLDEAIDEAFKMMHEADDQIRMLGIPIMETMCGEIRDVGTRLGVGPIRMDKLPAEELNKEVSEDDF